MKSLGIVLILFTLDNILALQTYLTVTRLRAARGSPLQCTSNLLDSKSKDFKNLSDDMCEALKHSIRRSSLTLSHCLVHKVICDDNLPLVSTRVDVSGDDITTQQLHLAFNLPDLVKESAVTIDYLQIRDFNECSSDTHSCHVAALCKNTMGSYMCNCKTGYTDSSSASGLSKGRVCDINCGNSYCSNNGACSTVDNQHVCKCLEHYTGPLCEVLKKDVEWVWILGITLVVATLILVPTGVFVFVFLRTRRKTKAIHKKGEYHLFT